MHESYKKGVVIVDVQRDFCEGGVLAASDTGSLLTPLQDFIRTARQSGVRVIFTQDWHPADHSSFKQNGGKWPVHCVACEPGSELMPQLNVTPSDVIVRKGVTSAAEGYSAFQGTNLAEQLRLSDITSVGICGIATEYCVRATALDAAKANFDVSLLKDLIRAVDPAKSDSVMSELRNAGVRMVRSELWLND
jgi:nicotinamidase/pyrazinamidase